MIKALEELDNYSIMYNADIDEVEESIIYCYIAVRLKPLLGIVGINENRINNMANLISDAYYFKELSIDLIINAIYNYINITSHCPSDKHLSDGIETFLEEYDQDEE